MTDHLIDRKLLNAVPEGKFRYFLTIEYDGSRFYGWQRQTQTSQTVQGYVEKALEQLTKELVAVTAAGRTDAGVHARGQVAHVDLQKEWPLHHLMGGLNRYLRGKGVAILGVRPSTLHARFDATYRAYEYMILNRRAPSPLWEKRALHCPYKLDFELLQKGCEILRGFHNFDAFRVVQCQANNPERRLDEASVVREGDFIKFRFKARAFLHHQIRIMVGTLLRVGQNRFSLEGLKQVLKTPNKKLTGPTIPPDGLYFLEVGYPEAH